MNSIALAAELNEGCVLDKTPCLPLTEANLAMVRHDVEDWLLRLDGGELTQHMLFSRNFHHSFQLRKGSSHIVRRCCWLLLVWLSNCLQVILNSCKRVFLLPNLVVRALMTSARDFNQKSSLWVNL